ncbi:MAG TPA: hypothetical protein VFA64_15810 [Hyphomicrobiaceae bacterium]|nr:hypothetical protein [Hyphomicrobiaceae bacterium]
MTPEDFTAKVQELRTIIADQATELEENPRWGGPERVEILHELEQLVDQLESLIEALEAEPDEAETGDDE